MTKKTFIAALLALMAVDGAGVRAAPGAADGAQAAEPLTAKVLGHRVNLRAKADLNAEVVGQVSETDVLQVKSVQDTWVEVRPPESVDLWINRDLVSDNKIAVNKANVRAGPGINYTVVGTLSRGDEVTAKGTFGEWVRIAPFDSASLWVNRDLLEINYPFSSDSKSPEPDAAGVTMEPPTNVESPISEMPAPRPEKAAKSKGRAGQTSDLNLVPLKGQGESIELEGILKPAPYLFSRPSPFRLARKTGGGFETVCYLRGNNAQLESLRDQHLRIKGRQYWEQGARVPVLVVEKIQKLRAVAN